MLVFSIEEHGGPVIGGIAVPGYLDPVPPARIPFKSYKENRAQLKLAPYTPDRLQYLFGGSPPQIHFNYNDIRRLSFSHLVDLCRYFGITSSKTRSEGARRKAVREFLKENG